MWADAGNHLFYYYLLQPLLKEDHLCRVQAEILVVRCILPREYAVMLEFRNENRFQG